MRRRGKCGETDTNRAEAKEIARKTTIVNSRGLRTSLKRALFGAVLAEYVFESQAKQIWVFKETGLGTFFF